MDAQNTFTETTTKSWGSRLGGAVKGIVGSLILFLGSFVVLFMNENRDDLSLVAKRAVQIEATSSELVAQPTDTLVAASGVLTATVPLSDGGRYLKEGAYVAISRKMEMYQWAEKCSSESKKNMGGSETTETTCTYNKEWSSMERDSSSFKKPEGHENPPFDRSYNETFVATDAMVGDIRVDVKRAELRGYTGLALSDANVALPAEEAPVETTVPPTSAVPPSSVAAVSSAPASDAPSSAPAMGTVPAAPVLPVVAVPPTEPPTVPSTVPVELVERTVRVGNFVFVGKGSMTKPELGDVRLSFSVVPSGTDVTAFGAANGTSIVGYVDEGTGKELFLVYPGTKAQAVKALHDEFTMWTWILRFLGFFMMWTGLSGLVAVVSVLLDVLPILGDVSRAVTGIITFVIALVLSIVTILVAMIFSSPIALVIVALLAIGGGWWWIQKKKRPKTAAA